MEPLIIRVSKGGRSQPVFHRMDKFPFRIGRAYDNDLIIADETVSAHHLELYADENGYQIKSLVEENGTWIGKEKLEQGQHSLGVPITVNIGRTHLEMHAADSVVEPTLIIARTHRVSEICSHIAVGIAFIFTYFLVDYYFAYQQSSVINDWNEILINQVRNYRQIDFFGYPLILAGIMSVVSRIFHHSWRFPLQLSIASLAFMGFLFVKEFTSEISYFFTSWATANIIMGIFSAIFFAWLLTWQLRAASTISVKRAAFVGIAVTWIALGIQNIQVIVLRPDFSPQPRMHNLVQLHDIRLLPAEDSIDDFLAEVKLELQNCLEKELERDSS